MHISIPAIPGIKLYLVKGDEQSTGTLHNKRDFLPNFFYVLIMLSVGCTVCIRP